MLVELAFLKESELKAALEFVDLVSEVSEQETTKNDIKK
jgi:hypothetical protein